MTHFRTPRFWLLTSAALLFGSHANAQSLPNYHVGAPTVVAAAPSLPNIPPEQIARDVTSEFNPRTGVRELVAAPFDPLEEDPTLAGSLRLRSADGAVAIDGRPLRNGALVELDFYYNSPSDDPYGGRNYSDAVFINGEFAPVVLRDTRILECSTRVENLIYDQASYYDGGYSTGIYRPYRHYTGFSSFGLGFGSNYFGPGYSFFGGSSAFGTSRSFGTGRSFGARNNRNIRSSRSRTDRRGLGTVRNRNSDERRETRRETRRENRRDDTRSNFTDDAGNIENRTVRPRRTNARRLTNRNAGNVSPRARIRSSAPQTQTQAATAQSSQPQAQSRTQAQTQTRAQSRTQRRATRQAQPSGNGSQRSDVRKAEARSSSPKRQKKARSTSNAKKSSTSRSASRKSSTARSNSSSRKSSSRRSSTNRSSSRNASRNSQRKLNFFPDNGYGGRGVVSSTHVDCAREDRLRVFIPNERLDAARFDGLTLIALDAQGGETPIYLPPNYIEGFRLAATGRVRPQGIQPAPTPQYQTPQYQTPGPRIGIEAAPCPDGTSKQADGTCLQTRNFGYPTP